MPQQFPDTLSLNLPHTGCDSHAHLASDTMLPDLDAIVARASQTGVANIMQIFLSPQSYYDTKELFKAYPQIYFTIAIHPNDILEQYSDTTMSLLREIINNDSQFRAVGETGLDYYHNDVPHDLQAEVFKEHLLLAKELKKPVVIHSRDAFDDTVAILDELDFHDYPLVWHCFYGSQAQVEILNAHHWYISVPAPITYPANKAAREALQFIPAHRLLIETDCPYLSPQGWRGERNEPALTAVTVTKIAEILNLSPHDIWTQCGKNARQLFDIT